MSSDLIEISRCRDAESVNEIKKHLNAANIPYRIGSTTTNFDITTIGSGGDPEVIISVSRANYSAARALMEEDLLKIDIPEEHYLLTSSDEELAEIVGMPSEWSPFDVAHARRLAKERGIDPVSIEEKCEERSQKLEQGTPASTSLLFFGWLFSILGGLIGVGIAWSLCYMKEKTLEGEYFTYDAKSREIGKSMLLLACVMTAFTIILRFSNLLTS